jgi:hypothetical protein
MRMFFLGVVIGLLVGPALALVCALAGWIPVAATSDPPGWEVSLARVLTHGVRYSGMGAWADLMPPEDRWKVITFLSHLKDLPPDVASEWRGH